MPRRSLSIEIIGWLGAVAVLGGYMLVSFDVAHADSLVYHGMNAFGAFAIAYHSFHERDYQPGVLNLIWFLVALFAITRIFVNL